MIMGLGGDFGATLPSGKTALSYGVSVGGMFATGNESFVDEVVQSLDKI